MGAGLSESMQQLRAIIPPGQIVVYFDQWSGYENNKLRDSFRPMSDNTVGNLSVGDTVWRDIDPIHPRGKVYGFMRDVVSAIELKDGEAVIQLQSGTSAKIADRPIWYELNNPDVALRAVRADEKSIWKGVA
jgi:hypothetical protein